MPVDLPTGLNRQPPELSVGLTRQTVDCDQSGCDADRMDLRYALHPLTEDERVTSTCLLRADPSARMMVMPTHHIDADGHLNGFRFECDGEAPASCLPVPRQMFFGHTMAECRESETRILTLMLNKKDAVQRLAAMCTRLGGSRAVASLDCVPENSDSVCGSRLMQSTDLRTVDAQDWTPEPPLTIGLYHAYVRGYSRDLRTNKLFLACSGGLDSACDEFCNLLIDVGDQWRVHDVVDSVECWWLRRASQRARCRLLAAAAEALGIAVDSIDDVNGYTRAKAAIPCTDTFQHDLLRVPGRKGRVSVYNGCMPTTGRFNGILTRMAPSEGMCVFRGSGTGHGFGSTFGDERVCGVFPVSQPRVARHPASVLVADADFVLRGTCVDGKPGAGNAHYMCFDEAYYKTLERMQWNRNNGLTELIPIAVWARGDV